MNRTMHGFGFDPTESENHFFVIVPPKTTDNVEIYERFQWDEGEQSIAKMDVLKLKISRHKWSKLSTEVATEFNARLKEAKLPTSRFLVGGTPLEKQFGKELMVLLWGVEHNDPGGIPTAIRNWRGLLPEERWWLYTMTNASTGKINDRRGWRVALRYALCENPVDESKQTTIFDQIMGE